MFYVIVIAVLSLLVNYVLAGVLTYGMVYGTFEGESMPGMAFEILIWPYTLYDCWRV